MKRSKIQKGKLSVAVKRLSMAESSLFEACEKTIRKGLETFMDVGKALAEISQKRLYRENFGSFDDYLKARWGIGARQGQHLMSGARIAANLAGLPAPANESQVRPLKRLPAAKQRDVWEEATRTAPGGKVTAKHVAETKRFWQQDQPSTREAINRSKQDPDEPGDNERINNQEPFKSAFELGSAPGGEKEISEDNSTTPVKATFSPVPAPKSAKELLKAAGHAIEAVRQLIDLAGPVEAVKADLASVLHKLTAFHGRLDNKQTRELYVTCPYCMQPNFTVLGLRQHRCDSTPEAIRAGRPMALTFAQWERAADTAQPRAN